MFFFSTSCPTVKMKIILEITQNKKHTNQNVLNEYCRKESSKYHLRQDAL